MKAPNNNHSKNKVKKNKNRVIPKKNNEPDSPQIDLQTPDTKSQNEQETLELQNDELRRIGSELEYAQHKYYNLFDLAPVGYLNLNLNYKIIEANLAAANLFKIQKKLLVNKLFIQLIDNDYNEIFLFYANKIIKGGGKQQIQLKLKRNKEGYFWALIELSFNPGEGLIAPISLTISDITENKRNQEKISRQTVMLEAANDAIIGYNKDFRITYWNPSAENLYGYQAEEATGKYGYELLKPEYADIKREELVILLKDVGHIEAESYRTSKSGKKIMVDSHVVTLRNNKEEITGYIAIDRDITLRKQTENELRKTRDYLDNLINHANAPIICWNSDLKITLFNHAFEKMTGYTSEEVLGKNLSILFSENTREESLRKIEDTLDGKWEAVEIPVMRKDGNERIALWNSANIYSSDGKTIEATIAQGHDITERKKAEVMLFERETNLTAILNATPESIFMFDKEGRIVSANSTAAKRLNHTLPEIIGHPFYEFMSKELADERRKYLNKVFASALPIQFQDERDGIIFNHNFFPVIENNNVVRVVSFSEDITERRKAEEQIRKLSRAVEQSPDSIIITDTKGNIEYVNPKFTEITGFTSEEVIGENPRIFKSGYTKHEVYKNLWESIIKGNEWHGHLHNRKKNGELFWESVNISPIRNREGKVTHYIAIKEDITESVEREEQLNKLNRTLNALRHNGDAILHASDEQSYMQEVCNIIIEDCGHAMVWIGFVEDEECKTVRPVVSAGFEEGYLQTLKITWSDTERGRGPTGTAIRTGKPSFCNNMLTDPNFKPWREEAVKRGYASSIALPLNTTEKVFGAMTIYSTQPNSFTAGEVDLLSELADDFTYGLSVVKLRVAHDAAMEELKKHRDHLEELVLQRTIELSTANEILNEAQEVAHIGNWRLDLKTQYLEWSEQVYKIFGIENGYFDNTLDLFFKFVHPEDRDLVSESFWSSIKNKTFYSIDHRIIRLDGEIRVVREQCVTHYDSDEQPLYSLGIVQDITVMKKIEKEIELHRTHLEELVKVRTEELAVANRNLKDEIEREKQVEMLLKNSLEKERELNELKSRFISTTSHEFRTPLASILSSMQLIQRYRKKWQDEIIDNQFDRIKVSIFNLTSLLDDILTISHADSGKIIFNPQKLNLYKYCMELFEEVKHKANEKHEFIFNYSAKEKEYTLDSKLVRFIIVNLLSNAFKYSPKGGKVVLAVSSKSKELQISVKDEGVGISSEDKKQLFKPFFRAKNTKDIEGTGLGLSIVEKAVLMHNGNIKCNSAEGKGTRFMIKIPIR